MKKKKDLLGEQIDRLEKRLDDMDPFSNEYQTALDKLEKLTALKKSKEKKSKVSPDIIVQGCVTLAVVAIAYAVELDGHILSTKPLQFLTKFR